MSESNVDLRLPTPESAWKRLIKTRALERCSLLQLVEMADDDEVERLWSREAWFEMIRHGWKDLGRSSPPPPPEFFEDEEALELRRAVHAIKKAASCYGGGMESMFFKLEDDPWGFENDYGGRRCERVVSNLGYSLSELALVYDKYGERDSISLAEDRSGQPERYPWARLWFSAEWNDPEVVPWASYFYTETEFIAAAGRMAPPPVRGVDRLSSDEPNAYLICGDRFKFCFPTRRPLPLVAGDRVFLPGDPKYAWVRFLHAMRMADRYGEAKRSRKIEYLALIWSWEDAKRLYENDPSLFVEDFMRFRDLLPGSDDDGCCEREMLEMLLQGAKRRRPS